MISHKRRRRVSKQFALDSFLLGSVRGIKAAICGKHFANSCICILIDCEANFKKLKRSYLYSSSSSGFSSCFKYLRKLLSGVISIRSCNHSQHVPKFHIKVHLTHLKAVFIPKASIIKRNFPTFEPQVLFFIFQTRKKFAKESCVQAMSWQKRNMPLR